MLEQIQMLTAHIERLQQVHDTGEGGPPFFLQQPYRSDSGEVDSFPRSYNFLIAPRRLVRFTQSGI
jgi:hypothetical protein